MSALQAKAERLKALHHQPDPLVLLNAWDVASARLVEAAGYPALATTSAGIAWALGYPDGERISRDEMLDMVGRIARATDLPVSADLEAGYGPRPDDVAATVRATLEAGAVGMNLEDNKDPSGLLPLDQAVARVGAARAAADAAGIPFVINARTDGFLLGGKGQAVFDDTVRRANAYAEAGADCLFVPGVADEALIGALVKAIAGPVNILAGPPTPSLDRLRALGVKRVSVGGGLARAAWNVARQAAAEVKDSGTWNFTRGVLNHADMQKLFG